MKKVFLLLLLSSTMVFTGCLDFVEELYLNADGSGKYLITIDMSEIMADPMMRGMMLESMSPTEEGMERAAVEIDSVINMGSDADLSQADKALLSKANMFLIVSESKETMKTTIAIDFKDFAELSKINQLMAERGAGEDSASPINPKLLAGQGAFELKKRTLTRKASPLGMADMLGGDDENLEMMKMFMADATYTTIYHLPGKVSKTSIPFAKKDGKTVTIEHNFLDLIDKEIKLDGDITFKKR